MKMLSFDFERLSARLFVIAHVVYLSGPRVYNTGRNNQICVVSKLYQLVPGVTALRSPALTKYDTGPDV